MAKTVKLIDTTLREGEQAPGVHFTLRQKKNIIAKLSAVGVDEIELGISSPFVPEVKDLVDFTRNQFAGIITSLWCRCRKEDINHAAVMQPDMLSLSIPVSTLHLEKKLGKDKRWAETKMIDSIALGRSLGLRISVGFEDAARADSDYLKHMVTKADQTGASRVRIADTVGMLSPAQIGNMVLELRKVLGNCELAVHTHNDFGMATANAVAAIESGATWSDCTVLGLGERAGCAKLEELVGYFSLVKENTRLCPEMLKTLSNYVASVSGRKISAHLPVIGEDIFTCETGLHVQGLQSDPETYEPYAPEKVGLKRKLMFGTKSGRKALCQKINACLSDVPTERIGVRELMAVRGLSAKLNRPLTDAELQKVVTVY